MEPQTRITYLSKILETKQREIEQRKKIISERELRILAAYADSPRGFLKAIMNASGMALIAEVKKASPSKGVIREDFRPTEIAAAYQAGGATCLSVLTDETYFQGCDDDLVNIRRFTDLPVLRKDFIVDPYQVLETRALGADCILLIVAAFDDFQVIHDLFELATDEELDVLVEVHNEDELEVALRLNARLIGINNRNLQTFETDLTTTEKLARKVPKTVTLVSESAIGTFEDVKRVQNSGAKAILVGESLLRQEDLVAATRHLIS